MGRWMFRDLPYKSLRIPFLLQGSVGKDSHESLYVHFCLRETEGKIALKTAFFMEGAVGAQGSPKRSLGIPTIN